MKFHSKYKIFIEAIVFENVVSEMSFLVIQLSV